jgi:tRNA A-37 threonylcarbamoyl transferase component Bud32
VPASGFLAALPDGYFVEEAPRGVLAVHADVARQLHEAGYGPESDGAMWGADVAGRRPLYELRLGSQRYLVRRFQHGGLMRALTGRRYLDPDRPFRELVLSDSLLRLGIPTPRVVAARARSVGVGWELEVMTPRVEDAVDLGEVLGRARRGEVSTRARRRVLEAFGDLVRRLHLHGLLHADLQPNNVLVGEADLTEKAVGPPALHLLDLDRSGFGEVSSAERRSQIERLYRHVARVEGRHGTCLSRIDYARVFRGYDPERGRWKGDWRAVRARHALGRGLHGLGHMLERVLAGPRDERRHAAVTPRAPRADGPGTSGPTHTK